MVNHDFLPIAPEPSSDGRRERSRSNRARIVAAMLELVGNGEVAPGAARVAETAGVGLRTVFRHFADMEALYREMSAIVEARIMPMVLAPFAATQWKAKLHELLERRVAVFEIMLPYRISASVKRFDSPFLMNNYKRMLGFERSAVEAILPPAVRADPALAGAIEVAVSFQCWRRLRHDEELDVAAARAIVERLLNAVLAEAPD